MERELRDVGRVEAGAASTDVESARARVPVAQQLDWRSPEMGGRCDERDMRSPVARSDYELLNRVARPCGAEPASVVVSRYLTSYTRSVNFQPSVVRS
jgi:hypothetical protein